MTLSNRSFGPWTTSLDNNSSLGLSTFWRHRMEQLPHLARVARTVSSRTRAWVAPLAIALAWAPLVELTPQRVTAEEATPDDAASEDQGSPLLRQLQQAGAPLLRTMADEHGYALADDQALRRVAPPFPDIRMKWYFAESPGQAEAIPTGPDGIIFHWKDNALKSHGATFGLYTVEGLLTGLAGVYPQRIEGPQKLRTTDIPGDWILRPDAPPKQVIEQLQDILNRELSLGVRFRLREAERDVYVLHGNYKFKPLPGQPGVDETQLVDRVSRTDSIQIFGDRLVPNSGAGGGTGSFPDFCDWLGRWIGFPVIDEVERGPTGEVSWGLHAQSPFTADQNQRAHDAELVLANITLQTGLKVTKEKRPIEILFIEREAENPGAISRE